MVMVTTLVAPPLLSWPMRRTRCLYGDCRDSPASGERRAARTRTSPSASRRRACLGSANDRIVEVGNPAFRNYLLCALAAAFVAEVPAASSELLLAAASAALVEFA